MFSLVSSCLVYTLSNTCPDKSDACTIACTQIKRERERERERAIERESETGNTLAYLVHSTMYKCVCVCVCVCEREREREREIVSVL